MHIYVHFRITIYTPNSYIQNFGEIRQGTLTAESVAIILTWKIDGAPNPPIQENISELKMLYSFSGQLISIEQKL